MKRREERTVSPRDLQLSKVDPDPLKPLQEVSEPQWATRMALPITKPSPAFYPTTVLRIQIPCVLRLL